MILLITGADGCLARSLYGRISDIASFRAVDVSFDSPLPSGMECRTGDLRDPEFVETVLEGADAVLHLDPIESIARLDPRQSFARFAAPAPDVSETFDRILRGTYHLVRKTLKSRPRRFILGSSLDLFDSLSADDQVSEFWMPRPRTQPNELLPWLAEAIVREGAREGLPAFCLRFGRIVTPAEIEAGPYDSRMLHVGDAAEAVRRAILHRAEEAEPKPGWRIFHITAPGDHPKVRLGRAAGHDLGFHPVHEIPQPAAVDPTNNGNEPSPDPIPSRPIRNVVVFGAGGPLGAAAARELAPSYRLRLTDIRPLGEIARGEPQSAGAPLPEPPVPPHEERIVDVTDARQVMAACEGMDAVVNCSVLRDDVGMAFRVNAIGAYHIALAAVEKKIARVVQTGPLLTEGGGRPGYRWDYEIPSDAPPRPGLQAYSLTKFLGQEILRVYADEYRLEVPTLLFCLFVSPETHSGWLHGFSVSWDDAARAVRRALEVSRLPRPFLPLHILADLPHGRFTNERAKEVLDWRPRDRLEHLWRRG